MREHAHDWPVLSLYVSGSLENVTETGSRDLGSPCVVLYGTGAAHANCVGPTGFEQIQIEFDPEWLKLGGLPDLRGPQHWIGGGVCLAGKALGRLWCRADVPESHLADAMRNFVQAAGKAQQPGHPRWVETAMQLVKEGTAASARDIAAELALHPRWVAQAYRSAVGEGVRETARRTRVEVAAALLRMTETPAAEVAVSAGFCDQSHMIRCFLEVLGRTPQAIRAEWSQAGT